MKRRRSILPLILLLIISTLIDLYVFQGVKTLTQNLRQELRTIIHWAYWLLSSGLVLCFIYMFYRLIPAKSFMLFFNTVFNAFITLFVTKLAFILVLLSGDIYRLIFALFHQMQFPERSLLLSRVGLIISAIPFFSFIFGITRGKYHYKVHRTILNYPDLPEKFNGFTILQISDVHSGGLDNRQQVQKGIDLIKAQKADLFVFTGDLVNNVADEILPWIDLFKQITAPCGKFAILGNHDYGDYVSWESARGKEDNLEQLKRYHAMMGNRLLLDEHVPIERAGQKIALVGVENWGLGFGRRGNLEKALKGLDFDMFKILLSHDPSHWDEQVKNNPSKINLTLSGHTHGMQFGIEVFGLKWSPVKYRYPNWAGLAEYKGRYLYVNRGFGFLGFSGRIGIWPEITVIELRKK